MKTALITGANRGMGFEVAKQLGEKGFKIIITARNEEKGQNATQQLVNSGIDAVFVQMDVSEPDSIQEAFDKTKAITEKLDVLINNAGIIINKAHTVFDITPNEMIEMFKTNAFGPFWVTQTFFPLLEKGSRVIMISAAVGAFSKGITKWAPAYTVSKTALNALTRQLDSQLKRKGILVNAVAPGWVKTDFGGDASKKPPTAKSPAEGVSTAVWLATEAPSKIKGKFVKDNEVINW